MADSSRYAYAKIYSKHIRYVINAVITRSYQPLKAIIRENVH